MRTGKQILLTQFCDPAAERADADPRSPAICRCLRPLVCKRRTASSLKARSNRRPLFPFCFDICTSCDQNPIAGRLHFRQQGPSSPSASTGGSTRSTPSAHCSASRATPLLQPMPSFTRESGGTLHVAAMGVNRIGKVSPSDHRRTRLRAALEDRRRAAV